jgi:hypothetical protein
MRNSSPARSSARRVIENMPSTELGDCSYIRTEEEEHVRMKAHTDVRRRRRMSW